MPHQANEKIIDFVIRTKKFAREQFSEHRKLCQYILRLHPDCVSVTH
ncbi:MAG: hypothetical protein R2912_00020 [Eubacteriales bacterium]